MKIKEFVKNYAEMDEIRPHLKSRGIFASCEMLQGIGRGKIKNPHNLSLKPVFFVAYRIYEGVIFENNFKKCRQI